MLASGMPRMTQRSVAKSQSFENVVNSNRLSWDDLRVFLSCATEQSFRKAAKKLRIDSSTVMRRIERLEEALDAQLFNRLPDGIALTREGNSIVSSAREMEKALFNLLRRRTSIDESMRGQVSISITEGLGSYWLMPRLVEFQREHPNLIMNVRCAMDSVDVLRMEADMSIQFARPTSPDLIVTKLGRLHIYPFAAREYIDRYGAPSNAEEMAHHRLVDQSAPSTDGVWAQVLNLDSIEGIVGIRTNASTALFYAVEKGAGIGALPTYALALGAPIVPIDMNLKRHLDIWLTYHPDSKKTQRNALVIEWLKRIFNPAIYPWFRDEFIHPKDLVKMMPGDADINLFAGYFSALPFKLAAS